MGSMGEEAVTPTVGVVLMVAITMVLAGVVFVVVQSDNKNIPDPPHVAFAADYSGAGGVLTVSVVVADIGEAEWSRVSIGPASTAACTLPTGTIHAGDEVVCTTDGYLTLSYMLDVGDSTLLWAGEIR